MRKIFIIAAFIIGAYSGQAQGDREFYYYKGEKIYLDKVENKKIIQFGKSIEISHKDYICNLLKASDCIIAKNLLNPFTNSKIIYIFAAKFNTI